VPNDKVVILIPYWMQEILSRNQLQLSACLDIEKIKPLMSLNDLILYAAMQKSEYLKLVTSVPDYHNALVSKLVAKLPTTDKELSNWCWESLIPLSTDPYFDNELSVRLFNQDAKTDKYTKPYDIYDLTPEVCGIVVYPGYFVNGGNEALNIQLLEGVLDTLYVYSTFHEVAKTPFFKQYLKLMSK